MESLPSDVFLLCFSFLNFKDVLTCSCVCRRWYELCLDNHLWKIVFYATLEQAEVPLRNRCATLAAVTSWKFALMCFNAITEQKTPSFWDDVDCLAPPRRLRKFSTMNQLFARMLELDFDEGGRFSFPDVLDPRRDATVLSTYFSLSTFLLKLGDIAAVPPAASWLVSRPRITTCLIERLCDGSIDVAPIGVDDTCAHWRPAVTGQEWEDRFVTPVQRIVIKALESGLCSAAIDMLRTRDRALGGMNASEWVQNLAMAQFWTPAAKEDVAVLIDCRRAESPAFLPRKIPDLLSWKCDKDHAVRLSKRAFELFGRIPHSELVIYLSVPDVQVRSLPLAQQMSHYSKSINDVLTSCFVSQNYKATLIKHAIDLSMELKLLKDFLTLHVFVSAIGTTSIDQTCGSKVSLKHIGREYIDKFRGLKDLMSAADVYGSYLRHVKGLCATYAPYLPAHRKLCRMLMTKRLSSVDPSTCAGKLYVHIHNSQLWPLVSAEHIQDYSL